jgi:hypothetical protein
MVVVADRIRHAVVPAVVTVPLDHVKLHTEIVATLRFAFHGELDVGNIDALSGEPAERTGEPPPVSGVDVLLSNDEFVREIAGVGARPFAGCHNDDGADGDSDGLCRFGGRGHGGERGVVVAAPRQRRRQNHGQNGSGRHPSPTEATIHYRFFHSQIPFDADSVIALHEGPFAPLPV